MTQNQIEYWKLGETIKNDERTRAETTRHNVKSEELQALNMQLLAESQAEMKRANLAREANANATVAEQIRANQARENLTAQQIDLDFSKLRETIRQNNEGNLLSRMSISEQTRSHIANEALQGQINAETTRANLARESEQTRSNQAREVETSRHNAETEILNKNQLAFQQLQYFRPSATDQANLNLNIGKQDFYEKTYWPSFALDAFGVGAKALSTVLTVGSPDGSTSGKLFPATKPR